MITVSALVVGSAGYILDKGLTSHSNFAVLSAIIEKDNKNVKTVLAKNNDGTEKVLGESVDDPLADVEPTTGSIVTYLQQTGRYSDYASRAVLAKEFGIEDYVGTKDQNVELLKMLYVKDQNEKPAQENQ
jgi:hypothetical protein